ncbi:hypothetical protein ASG31_09065 [Chryseobacterium sp. Leaf404]|nr:hypothetical protein ASG31_09065 [Chryseobacterium sp. Leaf404]
MNKIKNYILPILFVYLSLLCLYVAYLYIIRDYNITKSIYQPYKTFLQISPFSFNNIFIAPLKGLFGFIGFNLFVFKNRRVNIFTTLFVVMNMTEAVLMILFEFFIFKNFSDYIDETAVVFTTLLFSVLVFFYFKEVTLKKQITTIICGIFLTVISYYLH